MSSDVLRWVEMSWDELRWVEMSTYLNTFNVDTMKVTTTSLFPLQGPDRADVPMRRYETTARLASIILKQCRQDQIHLCFCFISDWALSDWANTLLENFKCQKLMELNGAFVEGINWNKISLFSHFRIFERSSFNCLSRNFQT